MQDPFPPDPEWTARAGADEIAADLERLRRTASRRRGLHQRLRRDVGRAEVAVLGFLVVAAGFLALHLAQRGNEVSLTLHTAATSPTTPPGKERDKDQGSPRPHAQHPPEVTRARRGRASTTTVGTAARAAWPNEAPRVAPREATSTLPPPSTTTPTTTTSTSTTTSTTTTSSTTTTTIGLSPPPPP